MNIRIISIGKWNKVSLEKQLFDEYTKRAPWKIELTELGVKKNLTRDARKTAESKLLLEKSKKTLRIALDETGKLISSKEFAKLISGHFDKGTSKISFLIGGADGHSPELLKKSDYILSLGKMTWPHMLVRTMLAEQLYRAWSLSNSHPYHRG